MNKSKKTKQNTVINYTCKSAVNGIITSVFLIGYGKSKLVKLTIKLEFKGFSSKYYEKVLALLSKTKMEVVLKEDAHYLRLLSKWYKIDLACTVSHKVTKKQKISKILLCR